MLLENRDGETFFSKMLFIYLFERETERGRVHTIEQGRGRGKGRESPADSRLSTEPDTGLDPTTPRSQPKPKARVRSLTS